MSSIEQTIATLNIIFDKAGVGQEHRDRIINKIKKYEDTIINDVINIINDNDKYIDRTITTLTEADKDMFAVMSESNKCFMVTIPENPTMIRVFPEILIGKNNLNTFKNVTVFEGDSVFAEFLNKYNSDMAVDHKKIGWEPKERAIARLSKFIDVATSVAMARYVEWDKTRIDDAMIRDFAVNIDNARKPMELSFAEKPEDFTIMYGSGPHSCMSVTSATKDKWKDLTKHGLSPASFYAYFPFTKGCYIAKGKTVVARCVLYCYPDKSDKWYYGRIYANSNDISNKFIASMEAQGITSLEKSASYSSHKLYTPPNGLSFTIPGISSHRGDYVMPWPYFDNMEYYGRGFYASFDNDKKEFTITYNGEEGHGMLPVNVQNGVIYSSDYTVQLCCVCNQKIKPGSTRINSHEGELFCSKSHAMSKGLRPHITADGTESWQPLTEHSIKLHNSDEVLFTTMEAAGRHGYFPLTDQCMHIDEEGENIVGGGDYYRYSTPEGLQYSSRSRAEAKFQPLPVFIGKSFKMVEWREDEDIAVITELDDLVMVVDKGLVKNGWVEESPF